MSVSCRPAVMPATKTYVVRRLDNTEQEVTLLKKGTGSDCLDRVRIFYWDPSIVYVNSYPRFLSREKVLGVVCYKK